MFMRDYAEGKLQENALRNAKEQIAKERVRGSIWCRIQQEKLLVQSRRDDL